MDTLLGLYETGIFMVVNFFDAHETRLCRPAKGDMRAGIAPGGPRKVGCLIGTLP